MADSKAIAQRALALTKRLTEKYPQRKAGSDHCLRCADELHDEMDAFANAKSERFTVREAAFLGWVRLLVAFYIAGAVCLWLRLPAVTAALLGLGIVIMVLEFFLYKHAIDFLFVRRQANNVSASVEPEGEVRAHVIISGHHDSARVFNFFIHQPKLYALRVIGGIGLLCAVFVLSIVSAALSIPLLNTIVAAIATAGTLLVAQLWFFASAKATPGAGDNMISTAVAVEVLREIAAQKAAGGGLKHTRVSAVSFDAEEAGLRGARAFAKAHGEQLSEIPTVALNIDCPYMLDELFFLKSDINGSVKLSETLADTCVDISASLGIAAEAKDIAFLTGGTDAAELARAGAHATTLMAMPWNNSDRHNVYHTPDDTVDALQPECVQACAAIALGLIGRQDQAAAGG